MIKPHHCHDVRALSLCSMSTEICEFVMGSASGISAKTGGPC